MQSTECTLYETLNVLIVDDQKVMRSIIRQLLNQEHIRNITEAENGEKALEYITKHAANPPDVIICDLYMDAMDGMEFAHRMWRNKLNIPIIILTGEQDKFILDVAEQAGASKVITKPISSTDLVHAIGEVVGII